MVVSGEGIVDVRDGTIFELQGTPFDPDMADWPILLFEDHVMVMLDTNAMSTIRGAGCVITQEGSTITLNEPSHLMIGESTNDDLVVRFLDGGELITDDNNAIVSFTKATLDLSFENHSNMSIRCGTIQFNTKDCLPCAGNLESWLFTGGSALEIYKDGSKSGLLRLAPNMNDSIVCFDNILGESRGGGNIEYIDFAGVDTVLLLQNANRFAMKVPMVKVFKGLTVLQENPLPITENLLDELILTYCGSILNCQGDPNPNDGALAVFCPSCDGSVIKLQPGDHNVRYSAKLGTHELNLIIGYDKNNKPFQIDCDTEKRKSISLGAVAFPNICPRPGANCGC